MDVDGRRMVRKMPALSQQAWDKLSEQQAELSVTRTLPPQAIVDLQEHLGYLQACLECGFQEPFAEYSRWLAQVYCGRGRPPHDLIVAYDWLRTNLRAHFDAADFRIIEEVLQAGADAVRGNRPSALASPSLQPEPTVKGSDVTRVMHADGLPDQHGWMGLTTALVAGQRNEVRSRIHQAQSDHPQFVDVGVQLIQPAMYEIGRLWQVNSVSIAQEHLATAIVQSVMAQAFAQSEFAPKVSRRAIFACVEGNHHELGMRMIADAFEVIGWDVQFLGANTASDALVQQVDMFQPDLLGLSLSLPQQMAGTRKLIEQVRADFRTKRPVVTVGGLLMNQYPELWRNLTADAWSRDARTTLDEMQ